MEENLFYFVHSWTVGVLGPGRKVRSLGIARQLQTEPDTEKKRIDRLIEIRREAISSPSLTVRKSQGQT